MSKKHEMRLVKAAPELYENLREACYEICVRNSYNSYGELGSPCKHLSEDQLHCFCADGRCFAQKWLKTLAKARGEI